MTGAWTNSSTLPTDILSQRHEKRVLFEPLRALPTITHIAWSAAPTQMLNAQTVSRYD